MSQDDAPGQPGYPQPPPGQYWQPGPGYPPSGYPPGPGYPPVPGYPAAPGYQQGPGYPPPQYGPPSDENLWALCAYLTTLVASFIGPLVIYLIKKDESPFIRRHAAQSLNLVITAVIYGIALFALIIGVAFGLFVSKAAVAGFVILAIAYLGLAIAHLIYLIMACVKAGQHQDYEVPAWIAFRLVR
jgi:uncharacterized Tic20 family protein